MHTKNQNNQPGIVLVEAYDAQGIHDGNNRIANVSTLAKISDGEGVLIAGIVVAGNSSCRILARVVGPSLANFGVEGTLADPVLTLYQAGASIPIATNDDWGTVQSSVERERLFNRVGAFEIPLGTKDSVIISRVSPGAYTLVASGKGNASGQALIEIYLLY